MQIHQPDVVGIAEPMVRTRCLTGNLLNSLGMNIWLLWRNNFSSPKLIMIDRQHITMEIEGLLISIVHARSLHVQRRDLWKQLTDLNNTGMPRLIAGDFNAHLYVNERKGGRVPLAAAIQDFTDFVDENLLVEAHSTGLEYTWCNRQQGDRKIISKIDRCLINQELLQKYMGWSYKVLSRHASDHSPLIDWTTSIPKPNNALFRLIKAWSSHESFLELVDMSWKEEITGNPLVRFSLN
ncbi:hypothetical protein FRX31_021548 [Thalictrum thalictroides]|uniref:Endonuclease/exonuclease/phosphatase domain-containing protein n=1 Tax=Thalictrum thalictroides TaxID=46969 RepID=A0A7J6VUT7_THATH|nr:hypothetical protein FRX31_021548 [Thalictrum thalictroides]